MASELRVNTLKDAAGSNEVAMTYVANGTAKAWVNFNGTGTIAVRDALNVSGLVDNGSGQYTVNLTNALSDVNYSTSSSAGFSTSGGDDWVFMHERMDNKTTSSTRVHIADNAVSSNVDTFGVFIAIHGDLA